MKIKSYLENSPVFRIIDTASKLETQVNEDLSSLGLSYFQALILISIFVEEDVVYSKDLLAYFPLTKGSVSQTISILESKKFIRRAAGENKRLVKLITTEKGSKLALQLISVLETNEQMVERKFSPDQLKIFSSSLLLK